MDLHAVAQDITLYVKKGSVAVNQQLLKAGDKQVLNKSNEVTVHSGSLALVGRGGSFVEIPQNRAFNFVQLTELLPKKSGFSKAFVDVVTDQKYSKKKSAGVVTRGDIDEAASYSPMDSLIVLSDSIRLSIGGSSLKLSSDIKLYEKFKSDTIVLSRGSNTHIIACPAPGEYEWKYHFSRQGKIVSYNNYFVSPDQNMKKDLLKAMKKFQDNLGSFSEDMRALLLDEYCAEHRIYFYSTITK
jgi:hypothetical protein